jgi:putative ABC transport system permease protein
MMRPRWRKVFSDLVDNKLRTALVVFSIAVGVFSIGVISGAYVIIANDMSASYSANNPMNVELRMSDPFFNEMVTTVRGMHGVEEAEGRRIFAMRVRVPGSKQWTTLDLVAISDYKKIKVNLLKPITGLSSPAKKQVLLEKKAMAALNCRMEQQGACRLLALFRIRLPGQVIFWRRRLRTSTRTHLHIYASQTALTGCSLR